MTDAAPTEAKPWAVPNRTRPPRRRPAVAGRIAAAGLGATAMLSIMAALAQPEAEADAPAASTEQIVQQPSPQPAAVQVALPTADVTVSTEPLSVTEVGNAPIRLTATPVVALSAPRAAPAPADIAPAPADNPAPAPVAQTNGSR